MASRKAASRRPKKAPEPTRLDAVRALMSEARVDALLIRSTDRYLNEYVPVDLSTRVWVSGFSGSAGEVLLTHDAAYLAVDGRYWLQARTDMDPKVWTVLEVPLGQALDQALVELLEELGDAASADGRPLKVGFEPDRLTADQLRRFRDQLPDQEWVPLSPSPVEFARGDTLPSPRPAGIRCVDEARAGRTVADKLELLGDLLDAAGAEALLVQRLDELMWLANLRGTELPYQATFGAVGLATRERLLIGLERPEEVPEAVVRARPDIDFVGEPELWRSIGGRRGYRKIGFDGANNTVAAELRIRGSRAKIIPMQTPLQPIRARKLPSELDAMQDAFRRADAVVARSIDWACKEVDAGRRVTEKSFADTVERNFMDAGATGLSFKVISAAGKNAAQIHYGTPNPRKPFKPGELVLLDTGAYFEDGYATDLTRTFLVGGKRAKATDEQRWLYTLVLKAALAGMRAVLPIGARGSQLDAIIRAPIWAEGLDYRHGTGHGVGVNVHEFPPRVGPHTQCVLEVGHVFSIEPGIYLEGSGGIRIENLCTLEAGPEGFMRVRPMTFSPLDRRLIEPRMLGPDEKSFLKWFQAQS